MAVLKCKMCGGTIEFQKGATIGTCEYCGTKQTLPRLNDEKKAQLYDRANQLRIENEYDKAMGVYEIILSEDKEDAEAYWGIVLCKYGIYYVDDPRTHKRTPTINRSQYTRIYDDPDYRKAINFADDNQKSLYFEEAKIIDRIHKGILDISSKETPFDVFICYKEVDNFGNRTHDSVYAQEIYNALTKEGYKVFFSRITLEGKLGTAYEPYIFAALHSAKVMVVVGTSKENFNAVWVKNEWSRFLALAKEDNSKVIIPCYKDIFAYDLPDEFSFLQSQSLDKIGYMQDLVHGVNKILKKNKATEVKSDPIIAGAVNVNPLFKRVDMFISDGDWNEADKYCEKILDIDPENAKAYFTKFLVKLKVRNIDELKESLSQLKAPIDKDKNYIHAFEFATGSFKKELEAFEEFRKQKTYEKAEKCFAENNFICARNLFGSIIDYNDSAKKVEECTLAMENIKEYRVQFQSQSERIGFVDRQIKVCSSNISILNSNINTIKNSTKKGVIGIAIGVIVCAIAAMISFAIILDGLEFDIFEPAWITLIATMIATPILYIASVKKRINPWADQLSWTFVAVFSFVYPFGISLIVRTLKNMFKISKGQQKNYSRIKDMNMSIQEYVKKRNDFVNEKNSLVKSNESLSQIINSVHSDTLKALMAEQKL